MSIPLVQKADKDDINTSIIAIKRNIERINMLLGLSNSEEIDTSEFVKKSDIVDEVTLDNMQSVTSNAVARLIVIEEKTITTGGDGMAWGVNKEGYTILTSTITSAHSGNINQVKVNSSTANVEGLRFLNPQFVGLSEVTLTIKIVYVKK